MRNSIFLCTLILIHIQHTQCLQEDEIKLDQVNKDIQNQHPQQQSTQKQIQQWNKVTSLIQFQQIILTFPSIKRNINSYKLTQLLDQGGCDNYLLKFVILDNQVYCFGYFQGNDRRNNLTNLFKRITKQIELPDMYFLVHIQDQLHENKVPPKFHTICRDLPLFMMNKNASAKLEQTKFLLPDSFILDDWQKTIKQIQQASLKYKWEDKIQKAFFRGLASGPYFYDFHDINQSTDIKKYFHRGGFVLLSSEYPELIDAKFVPSSLSTIKPLVKEIERRIGSQNTTAQPLPRSDFLKYKFLLTADGFGAPWGRTPSILFSNSLLLKPYSEKTQWFYNKIKPQKNFIAIKQDLSDLPQKITQLKNQDKNERIQKMIQNSNKIARKYLTPQAINKYTIDTLLKYAAIQQLKLEPQEKLMIKNGTDIHQILRNNKKSFYRAINIYTVLIVILGASILIFFIYQQINSKNTHAYKSINQIPSSMIK